MKNNTFEEKVCSVDWTKYLEPEYFDPDKMHYIPKDTIKALTLLSEYADLKNETAVSLCSEILFAIGNNHRGTYYPVALEAIDFIIEIERNSEFEAARKCAWAVLNDLYYFQLELGSNDNQLYDAIEKSIREKLKDYSDD